MSDDRAGQPAADLREEHVDSLRQRGLSERAARATVDIEATMGNLRRSIGRRELMSMAIRDLDLAADLNDLDVLGVLSAAGGGAEVTVGTIAERLSIDPSRASRIAADVVSKALARRVASQADARRICLELTPEGAEVHAKIHDYKWRLFAQSLGTWPEDDLVRFAELFDRFSRWVSEAQAKPKA